MSPRLRTQGLSSRVFRAGAFSLIELLLTTTIILILFTMMYGFGSRQNQMNQKKKCRANLQKIYIGLQIYGNENGGNFPVVTNAATSEDVLDVLVPKYSSDTAIFICPGSKDSALPPGESLRKGRISYAYYMGRKSSEEQSVLMSDKQVDSRAWNIGDKVFSDNGKSPGNNHHKYGGNFLFGDGSMKASPSITEIPLPLSTNVVLLNPKP